MASSAADKLADQLSIHAQTDATAASATSATFSEATASGAADASAAAEATQGHNLFPQHLHFAGKAELTDGHEYPLRVLIGVTPETDAAIKTYDVSYSQVAEVAATRRATRMIEPIRGIVPRPLVVARPPHALAINPKMGNVHVYSDCDGECATLASFGFETCANVANVVFNAKLKASVMDNKPAPLEQHEQPADNKPATMDNNKPATTDNTKPATTDNNKPATTDNKPSVLDACVAQIAARVCDPLTELTVMEALASNTWNAATRAQLLEDALMHAYMQQRITRQTAIKVLREPCCRKIEFALCVAKYAQTAGHADVRSAACSALNGPVAYSTDVNKIVEVASLVVEICAADPSACARGTAEMKLLLTCVNSHKPAFFVPGVVKTIVASFVSTPIGNWCPTSLHTFATACAAERDQGGAGDQDDDGARDTRLRDLATAADALPAVLAHVRASHANKPTACVTYVHTAAYFAALLMEHTLDDAQFMRVMTETPQLLDAPTANPTENPRERGVHSRILFDMRVRFAALSEKKAEEKRKQVQDKLAKFDAQQQELQELRAKLAAVSRLVAE